MSGNVIKLDLKKSSLDESDEDGNLKEKSVSLHLTKALKEKTLAVYPVKWTVAPHVTTLARYAEYCKIWRS